MLQWMSGLLTLHVFLLVSALCLTAPLTVTLLFTGQRVRPRSTVLLAGAGLALGAIFVVRTDWVAGALGINALLIAVLLCTRNRLTPRDGGLLLAAGFFAAGVYVIWRMEWFDVWRHGVPPVRYVLQTMEPYPAALAAAGWLLGARLASPGTADGEESRSRPPHAAPI